MAANSYWKNRIIKEELQGQKIARSFSQKELEYYKKALIQIDGKIDKLYTIINYGYEDRITRSELWQYSYYLDLRDTIIKEIGEIGEGQVRFTEDAINKVYERTLGIGVEDTKKVAGMNKYNTKRILNTTWSGKSFSERIYENTNLLASRMEKHITDMIVLGKTPEDIKKEIRYEFGVSYNQADRLVRTECSYAFNQACLDRYKEKQVTFVEFLAEDDACDECAECNGKIYSIHNVPFIPVHPNCRCTYLPVIDEEKEED